MIFLSQGVLNFGEIELSELVMGLVVQEIGLEQVERDLLQEIRQLSLY
jgi:hypothetical protein